MFPLPRKQKRPSSLEDSLFRYVFIFLNPARTRADITFVIEGAAKRLRPKLMTVSVALFGLVPVLWATGVGSDVMLPIVLPMIGGVLTSSTHILLVTPIIFEMTKRYELRKYGKLEVLAVEH